MSLSDKHDVAAMQRRKREGEVVHAVLACAGGVLSCVGGALYLHVKCDRCLLNDPLQVITYVRVCVCVCVCVCVLFSNTQTQ